MFRKIVLMFFVLLSAELLQAQITRTAAMGGLKYSVDDRELKISPYYFGNNPAWIYMDEAESFLRITPTLSNSWGSYRRKYDSDGVMNLGTSFHGIKTLGTKGTFSGFTSYNYENRRNVYRTLKKDSYNGEAFFINDTTASNFRYMGPKVVLMYSWELIDNLYAGGNITYQLLDGLKEQYSYAKTIYRNTGIKLGLAYKIGENIIAGADFEYLDSQESIEAADVNLLEVEVFYFRGEGLFTSKRSSTMTSKIRKKGFNLGSQFCWDNGYNLAVGLQANYSPSDSKILRPYYDPILKQSFDEAEDSYASFDSYDLQVKAQYKIEENFQLGAYAGYFKDYSWSRISLKDLLMWKWTKKEIIAGIGSSYSPSPKLLFGLEYQININAADSSKYIDRRFNSVSSTDHSIRLGSEYKLADEVFLRAGFNYGIIENDLVFGSKDCSVHKISAGIGMPFFDLFIIDANIQYTNISPRKGEISRSFIIGNLAITL